MFGLAYARAVQELGDGSPQGDAEVESEAIARALRALRYKLFFAEAEHIG